MKSTAYRVRLAIALASLAIAAGCGGGGGGGTSNGGTGGTGGTGGADGGTALTFSPSVINVSLPVNAPVDGGSGSPLDGSFKITIGNIPVAAQALGGHFTSDGIAEAEIESGFSSTATMHVYLRGPSALARGTYNERVTLHACTDTACNAPIAGTEATLAITYTVTAATVGHEPAIQFTPASIDVRALTQDPDSGPRATLQFNLQNFGAAPFVKVEQATSAIQIINNNPGTATQGSVEFQFKDPSVLGRGVYSDPLTVTVCLDSNCVNPVAGSPFTIPATYTIDDTISVPGTNGYTLRVLHIETLGWAWDAADGWLLVTTKYDNNFQSFLLAVDPTSGTVVSRTLLDGDSSAVVEVSDDDQYVYLGVGSSIERLTLPDMQLDLTIPLGRDPSNTAEYTARNVRVLPGNPHVLAATLLGGAYEQVAVFDDGNKRANVLMAQPGGPGDPIAEHLRWGPDANTLFGTGYGTGAVSNFYKMSVDATGITAQQAYPGIPDANGSGYNPDVLHPGNGLFYTEAGFAIDPTTGAVVRQFALDSTYYSMQTDEALNRLYSVGRSPSQFDQELRIMDLVTGSQLAHVTLPDFLSILPRTLVRWGSQGVAFGTGGSDSTYYLVFVSGPAIAP